MKLRDRFARFMYGRYGADRLSRFITFVPFILLLIASVFTGLARGIPTTVFWALSMAVLIYGMYRMFSKNIEKRRAENDAYVRIASKVTGFFKLCWQRIRDFGKYKYFKCPSCKTNLRVPRKKGRVMVTCTRCGTKFEGRT